jgi:hypothetical protein
MSAVSVAQIVDQLRRLPPHGLVVVHEFVQSLIERQSLSEEATDLAESGMDDYRSQLEAYEDKLARGEIQW